MLPQRFETPSAGPSVIFPKQNNSITQKFILKYFTPNLKMYISYRSANTQLQQFARFEMSFVFNTYQRDLILEKNQTYEYFYSVEQNGQEQKEIGIRQFCFDQNMTFDIDEWNSRWIHYQIEALNETLYNKAYIEVVGDNNFKLRLKKYDPNPVAGPPGFQQKLQTKKMYYQSGMEKLPLNMQTLMRIFSFVLIENEANLYLCKQLKILENKRIRMNKIFVNFDTLYLVRDKLTPPLKDYVFSSLAMKQGYQGNEMLNKVSLELQQTQEELQRKITEADEQRKQAILFSEKYQTQNFEFQQIIIKNEEKVKNLSQQYENLRRAKEEELKIQMQKKQSELDEIMTKYDNTARQLKQMQEVIQKSNLSDNHLDQDFQEIFQFLPQQYQNDIKETLKQYENNIQQLKKQNVDFKDENIYLQSKAQQQTQEIKAQEQKLRSAKEKLKQCQDVSETVDALNNKVKELKMHFSNGQEQVTAQTLLIKKLLEKLEKQSNELRILKINYDILVKQLEEQIKINEELKLKNAQNEFVFNQKQQQIQQELQKQEETYRKSKEQLEKENKERNDLLRQQKMEMEQQQLKIKNDANDDMQKQIQKIQERENEILSLQQRVTELQEQLEEFQQNHPDPARASIEEQNQYEQFKQQEEFLQAEFQDYVEQFNQIKELEDIEDNEQLETLINSIIEMNNLDEKKLLAQKLVSKIKI